MKEKIRKWYEGRWVPYENPPGSQVHIFGGEYERHWTASVARVLVTFYLAHWKWLWGFAASLVVLWSRLK